MHLHAVLNARITRQFEMMRHAIYRTSSVRINFVLLGILLCLFVTAVAAEWGSQRLDQRSLVRQFQRSLVRRGPRAIDGALQVYL